VRRPPKNRTGEFPRIRLKPLQRLPKEPGRPTSSVRWPSRYAPVADEPPLTSGEDRRRCRQRSHWLAFLSRFYPFSRDERPGESQHPFGSAISPAGGLSGRLPTGLRFLRHPLPAYPTASLAVRLPLRAGIRAYRVPPMYPSRLGSASPPVAMYRRAPNANGDNPPRTFWFRPTAAWACSN